MIFMKIIEHGNPDRTKRFKFYTEKPQKMFTFQCADCGCKFEVCRAELNVGEWYHKPYFYCDCPECGNRLNRDYEEENEYDLKG